MWLCLRIDEKLQEAKIEIYQSKCNLKPFDTINLISDRIQLESSIKQIQKMTLTNGFNNLSLSSSVDTISSSSPNLGDNIYEEVNDELINTTNDYNIPNFDGSSLVLFIYNTTIGSNNNNKIMLKIGFKTFSAKNIW